MDVVPWARKALLVRSLKEHIEEHRKDTEFMERLQKRLEEDRPILEALKRSEEEDKEA